MFPGREIEGKVKQADSPCWDPLVEAVGEEFAGRFMWMGEIRLSDGTDLHAYKHRMNRQYLHLAPDGRQYWFDSGSYFEVKSKCPPPGFSASESSQTKSGDRMSTSCLQRLRRSAFPE